MSKDKPKKKTWKKVLTVLILIPVIIGVALTALYLYADNRVDIKAGYNREIETGAELEAKYLAGGDFETKKFTAKAADPMKKYTVYYPEEMESSGKTYPMILILNGTGGKATKIEPQFDLFASWGFIVVGNQDKTTGHGTSAVATLHYMLDANEDPDSVFYHKIDLDNIGITGFSQGGAGVYNVLTKFEEAKYFKSAVTLSPVQEEGAKTLTDYSYDITKVECPVLMLAATDGDFELKTVLPVEEMFNMYDRLNVPKAMARRIGMIHDDMCYSAGGYVIAWFRWQLMANQEAAAAFTGENPELLTNTMYQDQRIDLGE